MQRAEPSKAFHCNVTIELTVICSAEAVIAQSIKRQGYGLENRGIKVRFQAGETFSSSLLSDRSRDSVFGMATGYGLDDR
jgi:hypothetical protein